MSNSDFLLLAILVVQCILLLLFLLRNPTDAINRLSRENRDELARNLNAFSLLIETRLKSLQEQIHSANRDSRQEFSTSRQEMGAALQAIRSDNATQLEKMRITVDEKLHKTLETRLGESFRLVSTRLEQVQKGLGEMHVLASDVGDLKKVLANVKTKGVLGEYQLESLLEQILTINQYEKNVKTKESSDDRVEFAVKIPSKADTGYIYLPIDAKFPSSDYQRLLKAYDMADTKIIEMHTNELAKTIKSFAKTIASKYLDPPATTEFAIMFLPFEGLYAEVLRIPGLFEFVQREYRVTITGPTTVSAFLNSLQMGFRSLAVEKHSGEVWELLTGVRKEFGIFAGVLEKTRQKIDQAGKELEHAGVRSRAIEKKLNDVELLPDE
ncbi:MAG: DNA recombination protein RmuC [Spirochaetales bacterium]